MQALSVKNLSKSFGKRKVLEDISFEIKRGEVFGLVGKNASGKSTLISILSGLVKKDKGEIRFFEKYPTYPDIFSKVGIVRENPSFYPYLSLRQNFHIFSGIYGNNEEIEVLEELNLIDFINNKAGTLSRGTKQKLGLALTLWRKLELYVLDEPMEHLDPETRAFIEEKIQDLKRKGKTIFITTHRKEDLNLCNRVAILKDGRIKFIGSLKDDEIRGFFNEYAHKI